MREMMRTYDEICNHSSGVCSLVIGSVRKSEGEEERRRTLEKPIRNTFGRKSGQYSFSSSSSKGGLLRLLEHNCYISNKSAMHSSTYTHTESND
jgi:hypothetical protein